MASVIQSIKQSQTDLKRNVLGGVPASVTDTQRKLRQDLGITSGLPKLTTPRGRVIGTGGTVSALDFTDDTGLS